GECHNKKGGAHLRNERTRIVFEFIYEHSHEFRIVKMCEVLEVSRSGYYKWLHTEPSKRGRSITFLWSIKVYMAIRALQKRYTDYLIPITMFVKKQLVVIWRKWDFELFRKNHTLLPLTLTIVGPFILLC